MTPRIVSQQTDFKTSDCECVCVVQTGNEAVLRARFQDAQFFFQEDLKRPLAEFRELLSGTLFQKDLGTLLDKSVSAFCSKHCLLYHNDWLSAIGPKPSAMLILPCIRPATWCP